MKKYVAAGISIAVAPLIATNLVVGIDVLGNIGCEESLHGSKAAYEYAVRRSDSLRGIGIGKIYGFVPIWIAQNYIEKFEQVK